MKKVKKQQTKLHMDDKGFSLLELLIAILILSIITIPFINLFVSSAKINNKSRKVLRATTVAQDLMEGLKSYDMEALWNEFGKDSSGNEIISPEDFAVIAKSSIDSKSGSEVLPGMMNALNTFEFFVRGIEFENSKFNARILVDPNDFYDPFFDSESGDEITYGSLNNDEATAIYSVNSGNYLSMNDAVRKDGSFEIGDRVEEKFLTKIKAAHPEVVNSYKDINVTQRKITVGFLETSEPSKAKAEIRIDIDYTYTDKATGTLQTDSSMVTNEEIDLMGGLTCSYGGEDNDYCNYYIYYYPLYSYDGEPGKNDTIWIQNLSNLNIRVYFVKQRYYDTRFSEEVMKDETKVGLIDWDGEHYSRPLSDSDLHVAEWKYKANFLIDSHMEGTGETEPIPKLIVRTNLNKCIANDNLDVSTNPDQIITSNQNLFFTFAGNGIFDPKKYDKSSRRPYIYKLRVEVFEDSDDFDFDTITNADALVTIRATKNN